MKKFAFIAGFLIIASVIFGQTSGTVRFLQMERSGVKYQLPVAYTKVASRDEWIMKYMTLSDLLDSTGLINLLAVDSIYLRNDTIFLRDGSGFVKLTNPSDSTVVLGGTGIGVVESPNNTFTVTNTGARGSGTATEVAFWGSVDSLTSSANLFWDNVNGELEIKGIPIGSNSAGQLYAGENAGSAATGANNSNFFGSNAGQDATGAYASNFFGENAGQNATNSNSSSFFGNWAGNAATNANSSNFFGENAGRGATNSNSSNFFGQDAGRQATGASNSNLFGRNVGKFFPGNNIGTNNIIIGTNISLPNATANGLNLGAILFGTGTYGTTTGNPKINANTGGRIGILEPSPTRTLDVTGEVRVRDLVTTTPTVLISADADGVLSSSTVGTGLNFASGVLTNTGIITEVDGSITNELQTISTTGAAGNITLSNGGGTLNLNVNDADASTTNEIQVLSQSFTGTTQANANLSLAGGTYIDTTGFMRLETQSTTAGQRLYRYKSNLGAVMGLGEDPSFSGNSNIEILRSGNIMNFGLRKDNASNGQYYRFNGTNWALATAPTVGIDSTIVVAGTGIGVVESPLNTFTVTNTGDLSPTNEHNTGLTWNNGTNFINVIDGGSNLGVQITGFLETEVDGSITNEGSLTVAAGSATTSIINSNTSSSTGVTITAGTGLAISEVGNVITLENTGILAEVDGSITNEIQDLSLTGNTLSLSSDATTVNLAPYLDNVSTNLTITGSSSPLTVNSSDGTDFTITAGTNVTLVGTSGNVTINATEVDGSVSNELQVLSQSFTGTTQANANLSLGGGTYIDTTGFMALETQSTTAGQRLYRYKSNLGAVMGLGEDPSFSGNANIEILRSGNIMNFGLRKDNASNGQYYRYNGTNWVLATAPTGTVTNVTASTPLASTGGVTPNITIQNATGAQTGALTNTDWNTFNNKVGGSGVNTRVAFWDGTNVLSSSSNLFFNSTLNNLGVGTSSPSSGARLHIADGDLFIIGGSNRRFLMGSSVSDGTWGGMRWNTSNQLQYIHSGYATTTGVMLTNSSGFTGLRTAGTDPISPLDVFSSNTSDNGTYQNWAYSAASTSYRLLLKQTVTGGNVRYNFSQVNAGTAYDNALVFDQGNICLGCTDATRRLDVTGEVRIRDLTTTTPTVLVSADATGVLSSTTVSTGLSLSGGVLTNTSVNTDNQNLSLSGQSLSITSGAGVTLPIINVTAGNGIDVNISSGNATVTAKPNVTLEYTSNGSFNKASYPGAKSIKIILIGAGAGGGSGQVTAKATGVRARGGGGGGAGGWIEKDFEIASIASGTNSVNVGTGGSGGAAVTTTAGNGNFGNDGGPTSFGLQLISYGGTAGNRGETSPNSGYGFGGQGWGSYPSNAGLGGNEFAGTNNDTNDGGNFWYSSNAGAGGGGEYDNAGTTFRSNGGFSSRIATLRIANSTTSGGGAGGFNFPATPGVLYGRYMSTGGGGGGGSPSQSNRDGAAGGGGGHGAGGGGGAGVLSTGSNITSGSGGAGANGRCIIVVYY